MKYRISELENAQSYAKGDVIEANTLSAAKRTASRRQMFQGTVLEITNERHVRLAIKVDGEWIDCDDNPFYEYGREFYR